MDSKRVVASFRACLSKIVRRLIGVVLRRILGSGFIFTVVSLGFRT